jgi:hypothetical protein
LIIETETQEIADDFISVIQSGILLAFPEASIIDSFVFAIEYSKSNDWVYQGETFFSHLKKFDDVVFGCLVTNRVLGNNQLVYALEKYKTSLHLTSFNPLSANPKYKQVFNNYSFKREYHTKAAFAIITAFSVIEELGLEIRSSQKNPRFIDNEKGEWNPDVLQNLTNRLEQNSLKADMTFDWIYRGNPTRIEQNIKPYFGYDSEWTKYGEDVRDKTLTLPEAIHNASYLRNYIAAHKFNELTQYISPYDVFNVQSLSRILIIRTLGLWDEMTNRHI